MSESEFDEILRDVKRRANANSSLNSDIDNSSDFDIKLDSQPSTSADSDDAYLDVLSLVNSSNNRDELIHSDSYSERRRPEKKSKKGLIIAIVAIIAVVAVAVGLFLALSGDKEEKKPAEKNTNIAVDAVINPLTGESGYNKSAIDKRPVAVVVENEYSTEAVRPQWGISDADIVLEGESEFSTRLLLFWADYTAVPEMVGPTRSARPPFIRFSQLFDCVFIHAGLSKTTDDYIGADTVFQTDNVDHINLLNCMEDGVYFGRNNERYTAVEHTGFLNGKNLPDLISEKGIDMSRNSDRFSQLGFNEENKALSDMSVTSCLFKWGDNCAKEGCFTYNEASHKYVTSDFDSSYGESGVAFENLVFLFDETEYVYKSGYHNGQGETYCDYKLAGGKGTIISEGSAVEISWGVTDGRLWMKTADGEDALLNVGKTYIGYGSSNNSGWLKLNPTDNNESY